MRFALRMAACCATIVATLWPTTATGDESALKRTAPDECIAWFSWAGLDALAKGNAKTNRTEQLLADEEVRAFLDSIAKNLDGAIKVGSDEDTKQLAQLFRALSKRPAVAFLTRIAKVEREAPPKASEPPTTPPQAAIVPKPTVTIGEDGLERIGIDFDIQATAGDTPAASVAVPAVAPAAAPQLQVQVAPSIPPRFGRTRKVVVDGKPRTEIEVHYPHGTQWQEIVVDFDFDLDDNQPSNDNADRRVLSSAHDLPVVGDLVRAVEMAAWVAQQSNAKPSCATNGAGKAAGVALANGSAGDQFGLELDSNYAAYRQRSTAELHAMHRELMAKPNEGFQAPTTPVIPAPFTITACPPSPSGYAPTPNVAASPQPYPSPWYPVQAIGEPVVETPAVPLSVPAGVQLHPGVAAQICTDCSSCTTCEASTTITVAHGAIVVDLGEHAAELRALYEKMTTESGGLPTQKISDVEFAKLAWAQPVWLAFNDGYVILAFDEASAAQCVAGIAGNREVPKWLVAAEAKLPVERPAARLHVNIDGITKLVDEPFEAPTQEFVKLLGLDQVSAISFVAGLDDRGTAIKTLIATRDGGDVSKVLDIFGDKGLTAGDLQVIPKDATMAAAGKLDVQKIVDLYAKLATLDDADFATDWEEAKKQFAEQVFIDVTKDLIETIGDTWTLHYAPSEGGLMATTFTLAVRDETRLKVALEKLALMANADGATVRKFTYRGQDVYYVGDGGCMFGSTVAWCIKDGRLVASMLPQTIKAHIARGPLKETLADIPQLALLKAEGKGEKINYPLMLSYTDTRGILQWCYQYGSFLLPTIGQQLAQADECTIALHDFPSLAVIEQYFEPSITTLTRTDAGLLIDSRQTVPMMSGLFAMSVVSGVAGVENVILSDSGTDVLASVGSVAEAPMQLLAESVGGIFVPTAPSGVCMSGECSPYPVTAPPMYEPVPPPLPGTPIPGTVTPPTPSPYWYQDDVQYYTPPAGTTPQPAPSPRSKPGPWTGGPAPVVNAPYIPNGTPVPYAPSGQPYVPPPTTPPNLPATYQTPYSPYRTPPAPEVGPQGAPIGLPSAPAAPSAAPHKPGMSYPRPSSAPSGASAPYGGKEHANPPLSKPVPAEASPSNATKATQPGSANPYYTTRGPRDFLEASPPPPPAAAQAAANAAPAQVTASDTPAEQLPPAEKTASGKRAEPIEGIFDDVPSGKLFRNPADPTTTRTIQSMDLLSIELVRGTPKSTNKLEPGDKLLVAVKEMAEGTGMSGVFEVESGGNLRIAAINVEIVAKGLSIGQARDAIERHLQTPTTSPKVSVSLAESAFQARIGGRRSLSPGGSVDLGPYYVKVEGLTLDEAKPKIEKLLSKRLDSPEVRLSLPFDAKPAEVTYIDAAPIPEKEKPSNPALWEKDFRLESKDVLVLKKLTIEPKASYRLTNDDYLSISISDPDDGHSLWSSSDVNDDGTCDVGGDFGHVHVSGLTISEARDRVRQHVRTISPNAFTSFQLVLSLKAQNLEKEYYVSDAGTIQLDRYGEVEVAGCTLVEARTRIENKLKETFGDAEVQLDAKPNGKITDTGARVISNFSFFRSLGP